MTDQLISFETAKLAKEKGFPQSDDKAQYTEKRDHNTGDCGQFIMHERFSAPTQSRLQKWLREEHNIDIIIKPWTGNIKGTKTYAADITVFGSNKYIKCSRYNTYEEALEIGLQSALNLIP